MPRRVTLLRHAKSSWGDPSLTDSDRPLNNRGERDAPMMGHRLLDQGVRPSLILTSSARRARQTARLVAREMNYPIEFIQGEPDLYLASPETMLEVIGRLEDSFNEILICAHNPGITELANQLCGIAIDNVPTCGIVVFEADVAKWNELGDADCKLVYFDFPKNRVTA
jgi:phosphohistidine phosphatase